MRQLPRFAAIEEFVRAARDGEITVFGRLDRTGEHQPISQQYWLYASVDPESAGLRSQCPQALNWRSGNGSRVMMR
jgi:hypothetical protein